MSIVQGTLPVGSLDHAITLNVQSSGGSHFETVTDTTPYLHRASPQDVASSMKLKKVVGGTIAWNQMVQNGNFANGTQNWTGSDSTLSVSNGIARATMTGNPWNNDIRQNTIPVISGHKYFVGATIRQSSDTFSLIFRNPGGNSGLTRFKETQWKRCETFINVITGSPHGFAISVYENATSLANEWFEVQNFNAFDLTQMFGSTIADYIYSLEQAHAGDGVAWFKALFGEDYYPYNSGELISVKTSARKTYNADNVEIGSYALDSDLELRGIPKLDGNNELYYDGDTYASEGSVQRKYGTYTFTGNETWSKYVTGGHNTFNSGNRFLTDGMPLSGSAIMDSGYIKSSATYIGGMADKSFQFFRPTTAPSFSVTDDSYTSETDFAQHMAGRVLVYELATPTTESADAYTQSQRVGATEEFVDGRTVEIPVGNVSEYKRLIQED